ncbi:uncharacterized protein LOC113341347 [Papaver somniferum]|uniref:uncharacterized protein LOC113341347 n=1 Tax=Papaver somniferum TaxID=3469 RepID=UPI000E6F5612|nr:uncharacterized protein LOC113341347 [Papaver somniferum]
MKNIKNSGLSLSNQFTPQREASDESHRLIIQKLKSELSRVRKEHGKLSVRLSSTQEKARKRCSYLERLREVDVGNTKKSAAKDLFVKSKTPVDQVSRAYSIPLLDLDPPVVSDDEVPPESESDDFDESDFDKELPLCEDHPKENETGEEPSQDATRDANFIAQDQDVPQDDLSDLNFSFLLL